MPNWCDNTYCFHGNNKDITRLYNFIDETIRKSSKEEKDKCKFSNWLGDLLIACGLGDSIDNADESKRIRCRGTIIAYYDFEANNNNINDYLLIVVTETAWVPMSRIWEEVINKLNLKSVKFSFIAEEPGNGIYEIYDPYNFGDFNEYCYYIEYDDGNGDYDYRIFKTQDEAFQWLDEKFRINYDNSEEDLLKFVDKINDKYFSEDNCGYICVHEYEYINEIYE